MKLERATASIRRPSRGRSAGGGRAGDERSDHNAADPPTARINDKKHPLKAARKRASAAKPAAEPKQAQLPAIPCTVLKSTEPELLCKVLSLKKGKLFKTSVASMYTGEATSRMARGLPRLFECIEKLESDEAICWGVMEHDHVNIVPRAKLGGLSEEQREYTIAREKANFAYPTGVGIMPFDLDGLPKDCERTANGVRDLLLKASPELACAPIGFKPSSSAGVYGPDGTMLTVLENWHGYMVVKDARKIPEAAEKLADLFWAMGYGYIKISSSGAALERCPIDLQIYQTNRIDFAAQPVLEDGLTQKVPKPKLFNEHGVPFDLDQITTNDGVREKARVARERAKAAAAPACAAQRKKCVDERVAKEVKQTGGDPKEIRQRIMRQMEGKTLGPEFLITLDSLDENEDYRQITVADLLKDPENYDGVRAFDPFEDSDRTNAVLHLLDGNPRLFSFQHNAEFTLQVPGREVMQAGEIALSRKFSETHVDRFRYVADMGKWFGWDGTRWKIDTEASVMEAAKVMLDAIGASIRADKTIPLPQRIAKARSFETAYLVEAVVRLARSDPALVINNDRLDSDDMLLNTPAGTVDLRNGVMRPHRQEDLITRCTSVAPSKARAPVFRGFLTDITVGDKELIAYLQRSLGACLSGAIRDHWLLFWFGDGRNGKNTLGDTVERVLGDYAKTIPSRTLMSDPQGNRHLTELASLRGVRLAISSEIDEGQHWNEARIKDLTGSAKISANFMRGDYFEFQRTHKHVVYGNYRPLLRNVDQALRSRLHLVPFKATFTVEKGNLDTAMPEKLWTEAGSILQWLIEGHSQWLKNGTLRRCDAVANATQDYFAAQSTIDTWVEERCDVTADDGRPANAWPTGSMLHEDFRDWKRGRGEGEPGQARFGEMLGSRFRKTTSNGTRYVGVLLKSFKPKEIPVKVGRGKGTHVMWVDKGAGPEPPVEPHGTPSR